MILKCSALRRTAISGSLLALGWTDGTLSACKLDESILGVTNPPYVIGDVLTDEQLSALKCTEARNGLLVCPIRRYDDRMFGVMIDRSGSKNRISTVLLFWGCEPERCDQRLQEAVAYYSDKLGEKPGVLDGNAIWKDREVSRRDFTITKMGEAMIAVMLAESEP